MLTRGAEYVKDPKWKPHDVRELISEQNKAALSVFDQYKLAMDLLEKESDRFWTRNNVFLLTQAALIAFYTGMEKAALPFFKILLSIQAFVLALIWMGVLVKGARYVARWDAVAREIEESIIASPRQEYRSFFPLKALNDNAKSNECRYFGLLRFLEHRTTKQIQHGITSLLIFWLSLIIYNIWDPVFAPITNWMRGWI